MTDFPYYDIVQEYFLNGGEQFISVQELEGYNINSENYQLTFRSQNKVRVHLKIIHNYHEDTLEKLRIFHECSAKGACTARVIPTNDGKICVESDRYVTICFEYYKSEQYTSRKEERLSAAQELGKLNRILSETTMTIQRDRRYAPLTEEEVDEIKQKCNKMGIFDQKVLNNIAWFQDMANEIFPQFTPEYNVYQIQHSDYHPANLLFKNGQVLAILDFDSLVSLPKNQSFAFACDRFSENIDEMHEFIRAYKKIDWTLTQEEVKTFPDLIKREALCRINYILRLHYFQKSDVWNFEFDKHVRTIRRMDCIQEEFVNI